VVQIKKILFVCVENAGRSQMAEGAFAYKYKKDGFIVSSAGNKQAKKETGIFLLDSLTIRFCSRYS